MANIKYFSSNEIKISKYICEIFLCYNNSFSIKFKISNNSLAKKGLTRV